MAGGRLAWRADEILYRAFWIGAKPPRLAGGCCLRPRRTDRRGWAGLRRGGARIDAAAPGRAATAHTSASPARRRAPIRLRTPSWAYKSTLARASATCKIGAIPSIAPPSVQGSLAWYAEPPSQPCEGGRLWLLDRARVD